MSHRIFAAVVTEVECVVNYDHIEWFQLGWIDAIEFVVGLATGVRNLFFCWLFALR